MQVTGSNPFTDKSLSIRLATDGFSFSTPQGWQNVAVREGQTVAGTLAEALDRRQLVVAEGGEVHVLFDYPSTRVPLDEFRSEEAQSLYRLTFGEESLRGLSVRYEVLPALELVEVYAADTELLDVVQQRYPNAVVHGLYGQLLLRAWADERQSETEEHRLHVSVEGRDLLLCSFADGRLQFANTYATRQLMGQQYFVLYVWSHLGLNQLEDSCVVRGSDGELAEMLKKYIRKVVCV